MGTVKKILLPAVVLCTALFACTKEDTAPASLWARPIEARVTGADGWQPCRSVTAAGRVLPQVRCGRSAVFDAPLVAPRDSCDTLTRTSSGAVRTLLDHPFCNDTALEALKRFARTDAQAMSDLAAGHYLIAQREDRPLELLPALQAAESAVRMAPRLPAARFNLALIQESLGFSAESLANWDVYLTLEPGAADWNREAKSHRDPLLHQTRRSPARVWQDHRQRIEAAARDGRRQELGPLMQPYPTPALTFIEEELLPRWAETGSSQDLRIATVAATEWSRVTGDPYLADVSRHVDRLVSSADSVHVDALRNGIRAFSAARRAATGRLQSQKALSAYEEAFRWLRLSGSPLQLSAQLGIAQARADEAAIRALADLDTLYAQALARNYHRLCGAIGFARGYIHMWGRRSYVDSLDDYAAAIPFFRRIGDRQTVAAAHSRRIGLLSMAGQPEAAWRERVGALQNAAWMVNLKERHILLAETATTVLKLGYPSIALRYQDAAVRVVDAELPYIAAGGPSALRSIRIQAIAALRGRAEIQLQLQAYDRAAADIAEALRRLGRPNDEWDPVTYSSLLSRTRFVEGKLLARRSAAAAISAYTDALHHGGQLEAASFHVEVLLHRAAAYRAMGRMADAEMDLRNALTELRGDEAIALEGRKPGEREEMWSTYFARYQDVYRILIQQLISEGHEEEAFAFADRARASEPLDLIEQRAVAPRGFRDLADERGMLNLKRVQEQLPPGTFVVQYTVLEAHTYAWVLSREQFALIKLPATSRDIERWSNRLHSAAAKRDEPSFRGGLFAPYEQLIAKPLASIDAMRDGGPAARVVFIPDRAMHRLPLSALRNAVTNRYLVEERTIEIAGSASLYLFSLLRDRVLSSRTTAQSVLLIGDPAFDPRLPRAQHLPRLPWAQREIAEIAGIYGPPVVMRRGDEATIEEFLDAVKSHTIVHFAGHAVEEARAPFDSFLLFAPSPPRKNDGARSDGVLRASELLTRLNLYKTRLVILSSCSTTGGSFIGPEGMAPLVRPFIAAGVPGVIGSLWDVDDDTAKSLLVSFHRHYRQGSDAAVALQAAQLELLGNTRNRRLSSVLAWAPFQVIGHASSPYGAHDKN